MLVSIGLEHRHAALEIRERFHLENDDVVRICDDLSTRGARETVLMRTCNRVEAYCWWPEANAEEQPEVSAQDPVNAISTVWAGDSRREVELLRQHASTRHGASAVRHLFRVSTGLESQVLGDIHILGQVRRAFQDAQEAGSVGSHLQRLFETALRVGKRVKRDTELMATRSSVGSEAARRAAAEPQFGTLSCLVVGCGKSGTQAARSLRQLGASKLTVVNRTAHRAESLARELGATGCGLGSLASEVARADIVIIATGASEPLLTASDIAGARSGRGAAGRLLVIDVSVPRNVEAAVGELEQVELLDLDALHPEAADVERSRHGAVPEAELLVESCVDEFTQWLELRRARRALDPFRDVLAQVCRRELTHLAGASSRVDHAAKRIVASVMAHPMEALRAACERGEPIIPDVGAVERLFASARPVVDASGSRPVGGSR